ncbi:acyl-CoA dehydrogenase family protein [Streptomyces fildesensis]|uniref:acyl-CoA dehydrogenase family protein n=1 Tax=Streptomyces fildesensis TaxID=375757 RepID=UPI0018DFF480|nr:acyl-CoA dehydrogenase family protein [Streptomyces fildesensis]
MTTAPTVSLPAGDDYLDADEIMNQVRKVLPVIRARASEVEANRRLPPDFVDMLRSTGVFRMNVPRSWGGPEMTSSQQVRIIEEIATADASTAWCAMIGTDSGIYSGFLDDDVARRLFPRLDMITAGWVFPAGRAERVPGGYRLSGRWRFGSGCTHADWIVAGCTVYADGEVQLTSDGKPEWRIFVASPDDYEIIDTWHTTGLRGSGSCDYATEGLFVPEEHSFSFYEPKRSGPINARADAVLRKMSGVPLGAARAAIDYARTVAAERVAAGRGPAARFWTTLSRCEMELGAARAYVYESLDRQWERLSHGEPLTVEERIAVSLSRYHAFRTGRAVVARLCDLVGGASVYAERTPLERYLRDLTTACQHAVAQDENLEFAGELMLGGHPNAPFL